MEAPTIKASTDFFFHYPFLFNILSWNNAEINNQTKRKTCITHHHPHSRAWYPWSKLTSPVLHFPLGSNGVIQRVPSLLQTNIMVENVRGVMFASKNIPSLPQLRYDRSHPFDEIWKSIMMDHTHGGSAHVCSSIPTPRTDNTTHEPLGQQRQSIDSARQRHTK